VATVTFSNRHYNGVSTVEGFARGRWVPLENFFTTQRVGQVTVTLPTNGYSRFRLRSTDVSPGNAFTRLAQSYGNIQTIAGKGEVPPGANGWRPEYEGALATEVNLSNPRCALADGQGNIFVVEQDGHAVVKITPDGRIHTVLGTHVPGNTGISALPGTPFQLNSPSSLWITSNRVYVLDAGNNRICYLTSDGFASEAFFNGTNGAGVSPGGGGGLWVSPDNKEMIYAAGAEIRTWNLKDGVTTLASGFLEVGNIFVNDFGRIIVADPQDNRVYRVRSSGRKDLVAGDGFKRNYPTGGDADRVSLPGARSVWYLPIGGYFVALDEGAKVWYVDADDNAAPFIFGRRGAHAGDGKWFRSGGRTPKVGNVQSVTVAPSGDILMVEGAGFVRKVDFLRHTP
jgi:hypothetical protein